MSAISKTETLDPQTPLVGRSAVVSGAGRGIGRGCAIALAEAGAEVICLARTGTEVEAVAEQVRKEGGTSSAWALDVTDSSALRAFERELSRVDILVNSAGTNIPEPFVEVSEEHLDAILAVNVKGGFLLSQLAARRMIEQGDGGVIIHISSQMGRVGAANRTVYCTTKHAVEGLTKAMAVELAEYEIRVNAVAPTFVATPMTAKFFADPSFREEVEAQIPLGRIGEVSDVVGAVTFLASPQAGLITGTSLLVDGGWTAQ